MKIEAIVPKNTEEAWQQAEKFYSIGFLKNQFKSVGEIFFVILLGLELGLTPAQAVQNIAIINGRATVWGDLMLAIVYSSGLLEKHDEEESGKLEDKTARVSCTVKRKDFEPKTFSFSAEDAERAGLWKFGMKDPRFKRMPWSAYPFRMLRMRARTFALRDVFPDFLKGLTSKEEAEDIPIKKDKESKPIQSKEKKKVETEVGKEKEAPEKSVKKTRIHTSPILGEKFVITERGTLQTESGVTYSKKEMNKISGLSKDEKKKYHLEKLSNLNQITQNLFDEPKPKS